MHEWRRPSSEPFTFFLSSPLFCFSEEMRGVKMIGFASSDNGYFITAQFFCNVSNYSLKVQTKSVHLIKHHAIITCGGVEV
jgi:hypothetical protein